MKTFKSKRFWLNIFTAVTMIGSLVNVIDLNATEAKYLSIAVTVSNVVLQVWFNQDKKVK